MKLFSLRKWHVRHMENEDYIYIDVKIANPLEPKKTEKVEFLVDTGASGCAISKELADKLNLVPAGTVEAGLADGRVVKVKATYVLLDIDGKKVYTWTIFGEGFSPVLGIDVMKALGFHLDVPERKVLMPYKGLKIRKIRLMLGMSLHGPCLGKTGDNGCYFK